MKDACAEVRLHGPAPFRQGWIDRVLIARGNGVLLNWNWCSSGVPHQDSTSACDFWKSSLLLDQLGPAKLDPLGNGTYCCLLTCLESAGFMNYREFSACWRCPGSFLLVKQMVFVKRMYQDLRTELANFNGLVLHP